MSRTTTQKNNLATAYGTAAVSASAHSTDPGATGASELTGGSPAYARKTLVWSAPGGGSAIQVTVTFNVPAGATVGGLGLWDGSGNFLDGGPVTPQGPYVSQGTYTATFTFTPN